MKNRYQIARITTAILLAPVSILFFKKARAVKMGVLIVMMIAISGCFKNYLRTIPSSFSDSTVNTLKSSNKTLILFTRDNVYQLNNVAANNDRIEADIKAISLADKGLIYKIEGRDRTYKHRDKEFLFSQIHLFTDLADPTDSTHITFPLKAVKKVEVFERDNGNTVLSYVLGGLGVFLGINALFLLIIAITCNCPQVYTYDGSQYNFKSGVFSGAIYSSLQRTDYLPLEGVQPYNGKYHFKLANNQKEEQFVNHVQLIQVTHAANEKVLLDRFGKPHTYSQNTALPENSMPPALVEVIKYPDGNAYMFNKSMDPDSKNGSIILNFPNNNAGKEAKLIVHAKNSMWSGYIFNEFASMFGSNYQKWIAKKDNSKQADLEKWQLDQSLPLMVYMQTGKGWKFIDYFPFTGNTAGRDMVMSIPISADAKDVKLKIESAYMFWELDYTAMDFTADDVVSVSYQNPTLTTKNNNESKMNELSLKDNSYAFLKEDDYLKVEFDATAASSKNVSSIFLSTTGYYHSTKAYAGKTQTASLYKFRKKGAFNEFSKSKFLLQTEALAKGIRLQHLNMND